ncbi:plastid and cyanobacterial ribosomal protein-domain-containing protein [Dunaliella salina]|uniref:30S ribosomal protein 3, chloroplastic n=1 Tax=Dunaliella salina TaxID=3046 RepID=A0ABQ7G185_DUNSA|nr:plastid and cyanobacterial ribosomal protein-domain-containing protein [Dunaliella salina]|eukprot:KAF5828352.1 plastid and cyanobacterial ribosomal protein-domain-containing protein [Dunaliella salina]
MLLSRHVNSAVGKTGCARPPVPAKCVSGRRGTKLATKAAEPALVGTMESTDTMEEDEMDAGVVLDDEAKEAIRVAENIMQTYTMEQALESEFEPRLQESLAGRLSKRIDADGTIDPMLGQTLTAVSDNEGTEVVEEDWQGATGYSKFDDEEMYAVSPQDKQASVQYKLTRQELANLVPQNWSETNVDWFTSSAEERIALPEYRLTFLWQEKNIAVAVDQVYSRGQTSPLTEYFVWPRKDAWEDLRRALESRKWMAEKDNVLLLNRLTEVINFWQDGEQKHSIEEARAYFPDCVFA